MLQAFSNIQIDVTPTHDHRQWYMTVEDAAQGYGVDRTTVMTHLRDHADDIREGVETHVGITHTNAGPRKTRILYREGVIKLGFFVRSKRAVAFRQWATDVIIQHMDQTGMSVQDMFERLDERMTQQFDQVNQRMAEVQCEVDELRAIVHIYLSDTEEREIRELIRQAKAATGMDGRAIVGHVRSTLGTSGIYNTPDLKRVVNVLRNLLGQGLKLT